MTHLRSRTASVLALLVGLVLLGGPGSGTSHATGAGLTSGQLNGQPAALDSTVGRDLLRALGEPAPPSALDTRPLTAVPTGTAILSALPGWGAHATRRRGPVTAAVG